MIIPKNPWENQPGMGGKIRMRVNNSHLEEPSVSLFIHNIKFFNRELKEDEYFYANVKKEGIIFIIGFR